MKPIKLFKLIINGLAILSLTASIAFSAESMTKKMSGNSTKKWSRPYGLAGCGLGSVVMGKKGNQIFAATTNGTVESQLFGITSGTLNCMDDPNMTVAFNLDKFVVANRMALAGDIARGSGETLVGLSQVMGCQGISKANLGLALQQSFNQIFPDTKVQANEVTDAIVSVIMSEQQFASKCNITI
jgi:hypothetical protein